MTQSRRTSMIKRIALLLPLAVLAAPAAAKGYPDGLVDVYYVPSAHTKFSSGGDEADVSGDGYGAHAMVPVGPIFLITGEYNRDNYDTVTFAGSSGSTDLKSDQYRVGFGAQSSPDQARLAAYAEYVKVKFHAGGDSSDADGFGLHLRGSFEIIPQLNLFGEIGYVRLNGNNETVDGPEFLVGGSFAFTPMFGAFVDYRSSRLDTNSGDKTRLYDVRTGLRIYLRS